MSLLMSVGAITTNKYKYSTYVGLRHPVIARTALLSSGSSTFAYVDVAHTVASYSAIDWHRASTVVLILLALVPHFEFANFCKMLLRVAIFFLVFCM